MPVWLLRLAKLLGPFMVRWLVKHWREVVADPRVMALLWKLAPAGGRLTERQLFRHRLLVLREQAEERLATAASTPAKERASRLLEQVDGLLEALEYTEHMRSANRREALGRIERQLDALMVEAAAELLDQPDAIGGTPTLQRPITPA